MSGQREPTVAQSEDGHKGREQKAGSSLDQAESIKILESNLNTGKELEPGTKTLRTENSL